MVAKKPGLKSVIFVIIRVCSERRAANRSISRFDKEFHSEMEVVFLDGNGKCGEAMCNVSVERSRG